MHIIEHFARSIYNRSVQHKRFVDPKSVNEWNTMPFHTRQPYLLLAEAHIELLAELDRDADLLQMMQDRRADIEL